MTTQAHTLSIAKASRKARVIKVSGWAMGVVALAGSVLVASNAADKSPNGGIPVISIGKPGNGGQGIAAPSRATNSMPIWWGGNSFILLPAENMSDTTAMALGYEYAIRSDLNKQWQTLRDVFAIRGDEQKSDYGWQISGSGKSSGSLYLNLQGLASWSYYSGNRISYGCMTPGVPRPIGTAGSTPSPGGTQCPPAKKSLPIRQALEVAQRVHAELGGPVNVEWSSQASAYSGSVEVTAVPLLDGVKVSLRSSTAWHYSINSDAKVDSAFGSFALPVAMSSLPILGARSAAERVNSKQWNAFGPFSIGGFPVEIMNSTGGRVAKAHSQTTTSPNFPVPPQPRVPHVPGEINVSVDRVAVTNPTATLVEYWNPDGTLMLLPGYQYSADSHRTFAVISVSDSRVTFTQVDHSGIQPMMK